MTQADTNNPFGRDRLRSLVAASRTPPNETEAEFADRQRRSHAIMTRSICDMAHLLKRKQPQPADTDAPPLAIEPIPPLR